MEKELVFQILGISQTRDENAIRAAYRQNLKSTNPEDDPEGFKRLRQAYEEALKLARQTENEGSEESVPKDDVDLWIDKAEALYLDILSRHKAEEWKKLLTDPVCEGLDTSLEAREKIIVFLMNHYHLPHEIWKLIDATFEITADIETLKEKYPINFLNHMKYYVENEQFIPYELFECRNYDGGAVNGDGYINEYLTIKRKIDNEETEGCLQRLQDLKAFSIYHPFEDVERLRLMITAGEYEKGAALAESLMDRYADQTYVQLWVGRLKWKMGEKEQAYALWQDILRKIPAYYLAKEFSVQYLMEKEDYYQARKLLLELLDVNERDQNLQDMIHTANEALIKEFQSTLKAGGEDPRLKGDELKLTLGWCLLQNDRMEEAAELLESFQPEKEQEYGYCNQYSQLLYYMKRYEEAIPYLHRWIELIEGLTDDGTEEYQKRISRKSRAHIFLSSSYYETGKKEDGEREAQKAIETASNIRDRLNCMQYLADKYLSGRQYEKAVDVCDRILKEDEGYYPAYLIRQEACFQMKKAQQVVDDYHRAVNIYAGYYKPYLFAAKAFFYYNQYEDAKRVIDRARENQAEFSAEMKLYECKILRNLARGKEDRKLPKEIMEKLAGELDAENCDIEDKSEVAFERGLLCWDDNEFESALAFLEDAIAQNPERLQYRLIRGNVYLEMKKYKEALDEYEAAEAGYSKTATLYYNRGCAYEGLGNTKSAVENFKKALEFDEKYRNTNEKLFNLYRENYIEKSRKEDYRQALYYINRQLQIKESYGTYFDRARLYYNAMELELSLKDYEKALEYIPDDDAALMNMGFCYRALGRFETALEYFQRAKKLMKSRDANTRPYYQMAMCYTALEEYEKALECWKEGAEIFPQDSDFPEQMGFLYQKLAEYDKALEAFEKMKGLNDDFYSDMAYVWIQKGDLKKGIRVLKDGLKQSAKDRKAKFYTELGDVYDDLLQHEKAARCYIRAISLEQDPWTLFGYERGLAKIYYTMGKYKEAEEYAKKAFKHFHEAGRIEEDYIDYKANAPARMGNFGWLYLCLGDREKAEKYFREMEKIPLCRFCQYKKCFESTLYLGLLYESLGDHERAIALMEETLERRPGLVEAKSVLESLRRKA